MLGKGQRVRVWREDGRFSNNPADPEGFWSVFAQFLKQIACSAAILVACSAAFLVVPIALEA
jgi:hypothetical protein